MATTWTTVHPIPWRNTSFTWLPYWIFDIIVGANNKGEDWRDYSDAKYKPEFDTLKQAYIDYTDVDFIESRNGYIYKLSDFTPAAPTVTITAKAGAISLKVGDPDLAASALFDINPSNTAVVLTVDTSGNGSIVSNKLHALKAGSVVVTCKAGSVSATKTVTITETP
ncbi:large outer capsid protein [Yersinia phage JC221]|nr:large outer capsid protein [Yersinia phage JC221]